MRLSPRLYVKPSLNSLFSVSSKLIFMLVSFKRMAAFEWISGHFGLWHSVEVSTMLRFGLVRSTVTELPDSGWHGGPSLP